MFIRPATAEDASIISALMTPNSMANGGDLFGEWGEEKIARWIRTGALVLLAFDGETLAGVLFTAEKGSVSTPAIDAMWEAWPGGETAYVYGPVCLGTDARGKGVLGQLVDALRAAIPDREAVLFINRDNPRSRRAHERVGVDHVAEFFMEPARSFDVFVLKP